MSELRRGHRPHIMIEISLVTLDVPSLPSRRLHLTHASYPGDMVVRAGEQDGPGGGAGGSGVD
jgi:hypothetical protein